MEFISWLLMIWNKILDAFKWLQNKNKQQAATLVVNDNAVKIDVSNTNQSGGSNIQVGKGSITVSVQPEWREISRRSQDVQSIILAISKHPGMKITVGTNIGDAEGMNYAIQFRDLLTKKGFTVEQFISEGMGSQPPPPHLSYMLQDDTFRITIGNQNSQTIPDGAPG